MFLEQNMQFIRGTFVWMSVTEHRNCPNGRYTKGALNHLRTKRCSTSNVVPIIERPVGETGKDDEEFYLF